MAELLLQNLSKTFDGKPRVHALKEVSLQVRSGEILALIGPSGSGKTTLLRLIAGLEEPSGGSILVDGQPIHHLRPEVRGIGMAFQYPALLAQLSARDNIALGLRLRKIGRNEIV